MEKAFLTMENLADHVKTYVNSKIESVKIKTAEKTSSLLSNMIARIIAGTVFFLFIIFLSFFVAYIIAEWTGKYYWGFLSVAVFYLLLSVIIWVARERLIRMPIMNNIIRQLFKNDEKDEED